MRPSLPTVASSTGRAALVAAALSLAAALSPAGAQAAAIFDFSYSFPANGPGGLAVNASGTLTTTNLDTVSGTYTITGITGQRNGQAITGLIAPGGFQDNDNLLYASGSLFDGIAVLDNNGLSFTVAGTGDDGAGNVNVYYEPGMVGGDPTSKYTEILDAVGFGTFVVTPHVTQVPEPASLSLLGVGAALAFGRRRRRSRTA